MRALTILAVLTLTLASGTAVAQAPPEPAEPRSKQAESCSWLKQYRSTLAELGETGRVWFIDDPRGDYVAYTYAEGYVEISPRTPCWLVDDVVRHEWMHLQMIAMPGDQPHDELVADCGARLLGADYTPYLDRARRRGMGDRCSGTIRAIARQLIDRAR